MKKLLIIEDDTIVANIYRNKFAVEGFQVETAADGESGLDLLHTFQPGVVILDLMLPKMSGVDFMKKVRAVPEFQSLPIIVFSNTYLTNLVQEAWRAGATKCLSKANCTPKQVVDVVLNALNVNGYKPGRPDTLPSTAAKPTPVAEPAPAPTAPASAKTAEVETPSSPASDAEFQSQLRHGFVKSLPTTLTALRALLKALFKANGDADRVKHAQEMYRRVHALTSNAGISGLTQIAQMADALEALLKELYEKPAHMTASTLRTVASGVDFLGVLFDQDPEAAPANSRPPSILVVDDEAISRRAVVYALEKAKLKAISVEDPQVAFNMLLENRFELVFLDVDMPGMTGYELCAKLRALPAYKTTPVVFVTSMTDFESRANSMMSGGNDFIAKPFLFIELAVKALVSVLKTRLPASQPAKLTTSTAAALAAPAPAA